MISPIKSLTRLKKHLLLCIAFNYLFKMLKSKTFIFAAIKNLVAFPVQKGSKCHVDFALIVASTCNHKVSIFYLRNLRK